MYGGKFGEIDDPKGMCKDITSVGHWGNGDIEVTLEALDQLEDIMWLVYQSFDKQREDADA
jgi:predicted transport protein